MPYARSTDATDLHYLDWGEGPPIVFTHGWAASSAMWEYQMLPLSAAGFRCVALDRRGCGRSDDPGHGYTADIFATDLADFLAQLDLSDVTLVAHSMGGAEAVRCLAAHRSDRVARLMLVAPTTPCLVQLEDNLAGVPAEQLEGLIADILRDRPSYVTNLAGPFFGRHVGLDIPEPVVQWAIRMVLGASALASVEMMRTFFLTDFRPDVSSVRVPTLIVHGDSDAGAPVELTGCPTHELIPSSELRIYEHGPHGLPLTHPAQLTADLLAFAKS